jgi:hypothetical protein
MKASSTIHKLGGSLKSRLGLRHEPHRFTDFALAQSFAARPGNCNCVVMGDHPELWVVVPADAEKLVRIGYELL